VGAPYLHYARPNSSSPVCGEDARPVTSSKKHFGMFDRRCPRCCAKLRGKRFDAVDDERGCKSAPCPDCPYAPNWPEDLPQPRNRRQRRGDRDSQPSSHVSCPP